MLMSEPPPASQTWRLAVGTAANVEATTSLAIGLGQTTGTALGSRPRSDVGHSLRGDSTPPASEPIP